MVELVDRAVAEEAMWAWYLEWSTIVRQVIHDRSLLRSLGFLRRVVGDGDDELGELDELEVTGGLRPRRDRPCRNQPRSGRHPEAGGRLIGDDLLPAAADRSTAAADRSTAGADRSTAARFRSTAARFRSTVAPGNRVCERAAVGERRAPDFELRCAVFAQQTRSTELQTATRPPRIAVSAPDLIHAVHQGTARISWASLPCTPFSVMTDAIRVDGVQVPASVRTAHRVSDALAARALAGERFVALTPDLAELVELFADLTPPPSSRRPDGPAARAASRLPLQSPSWSGVPDNQCR